MRFFPNCWRSNRSARGTKTHAERRIDASRGHAVVPGVVQLAFRHGIASVSEFVPADTHVIPADAMAAAHVNGREARGERRIALVENPIAVFSCSRSLWHPRAATAPRGT